MGQRGIENRRVHECGRGASSYYLVIDLQSKHQYWCRCIHNCLLIIAILCRALPSWHPALLSLHLGFQIKTYHDSERSDADDMVMRMMKMRKEMYSKGKCMNYVTSDSIEWVIILRVIRVVVVGVPGVVECARRIPKLNRRSSSI